MPMVAVLGCAALAGCGGPASAGPPSAGPSPAGAAGDGGLCGSIGQVERLVVQRVDLLPQNHLYFTFPAKVTVTDPARARSAAQAACALPRMPSGTFSCPIDMGIEYRLTFTAAGKELPPVLADAGGCGAVDGIGSARWTVSSPGFWPALAAAMGIKQPDNSTFRGTTS